MNFKLLSIMAALCVAICFTSCKDDCEDVNCFNGGACVEGDCECPTGFTGSDCGTQITDECPNGCKNEGQCSNGTCDCTDGWSGSDCGNKLISGDDLIVTGEVTITAAQVYQINGRLTVKAGGVLTIEPGAILKFAQGQEASASALLVARGGKLMAAGTAEKPIILTTVLDDIALGEINSPNLDKDDIEKWGGLLILGKARISAGNGDTEASIEGLTATDDSLYGGDDDSDSSGVIQYVSVRHGGINIGAGNEINGITLGGVGNGTTIDHIEVVANLDDGIEFFGGSVNVQHAIVSYQHDDAIDIDQNYSGTLDNFAVIHGNTLASEFALEIDGPEGPTHTDGLFTLKNGTIIKKGSPGFGADLKSKSQGTISNVNFSGYTAGTVIGVRASYDNDPMLNCPEKTDAYTHYTTQPATLIVTECGFAGISNLTNAVTAYNDDDDAPCDMNVLPDEANVDAITEANGNAIGEKGGANVSEFAGWSWASANGEI